MAGMRILCSWTQLQTSPITIRPAYPDDASALLRLADLDSSAVPSEPLIVAEVDGEIQVAVSMSDLAAIADPFAPTALVVDLVRGHIRQSVRTSASPPSPALQALTVSLPARRLRRPSLWPRGLVWSRGRSRPSGSTPP